VRVPFTFAGAPGSSAPFDFIFDEHDNLLINAREGRTNKVVVVDLSKLIENDGRMPMRENEEFTRKYIEFFGKETEKFNWEIQKILDSEKEDIALKERGLMRPERRELYSREVQKGAYVIFAGLCMMFREDESNKLLERALEVVALFNAVHLSRNKAEIISKLIKLVNFKEDKDHLLI